jgi:hypothetical protein
VSSRDLNGASQPGTEESALVVLSAADLAAAGGEDEGETAPPRAIRVVRVEVPVAAPAGASDGPLADIQRLVYRLGARALGSPLWLQSDEDPGSDFLLQFDESFVDVNLGDAGVMYVFVSTAFWQCH